MKRKLKSPRTSGVNKVDLIVRKITRSVNVSELKTVLDDEGYVLEDREKVKDVLESNDINLINEYLDGLRIGKIIDLFVEKLSVKKITSSNIQLLKKLFKQIGDVDLIMDELTEEQIAKYFTLFANPFAKKKYLLSFNKMSSSVLESYVKYELADSVEEKDKIVLDLILADTIVSNSIDLLVSHLKNYPLFYVRLILEYKVSMDYLDFIRRSLNESLGSNHLQSVFIQYFLFSSERIKIFMKMLKKTKSENQSIFTIDAKLLSDIKKLDKNFIDYIDRTVVKAK